ncbi:phage tail protein [Leptospira sp. GIMC2001]|uniref:phage tail protein n=1 Tax=Leptospira sp. GIMC2001 TaxID=1513297 RepID=UPI00234BC506|nr:phage tail protein [Leptospira sp. GIMC2001]WCL51432.1 phage tail protein [Leptospira sp. GIMC2001]
MPTSTALVLPNSQRKRPRYNANQRVNAKTIGQVPGLEDDIVLYPESIAEFLGKLFDLGSTEPQLVGGDLASFTISQINVESGMFLVGSKIYFLEPLTLIPTDAAYWGFYEFQFEEVASDEVSLQFWDAVTKIPFNDLADVRTAYKVNVRENYNTTAAFPTVSAGWTKLIEYKKDAAFGDIIEANKLLNSIKLPKSKSGTLATNEDLLALQAQLDAAVNKQIPLGCSTITDDLDELTEQNGFVLSDGDDHLRSLLAPSLLAKLIKTVVSVTPGTDRVNSVAHGRTEGKLVKFGFTGGGITALTRYYVRNPTANDFQISLTPSGSIIDLTSDQTGEMLTHVGWGFGNGSTTINVPDRRGIISRGAGVHGSRAKAAGGNYDGGAPGFEGQDMFQNMTFADRYSDVVSNLGGGGSGNQAYPTTGTTGSPLANGAGTPRTGNETTGAWTGDTLKTRIF